MKKYLLIISFFILGGLPLLSQNTNDKSDKKKDDDKLSAKPMELPEVFINGKESMNISAGTKKLPVKPKKMTPENLEAFNPLEKQSPILTPIDPMPSKPIEIVKKTGFLDGEIGRFATINAEGGYGAEYEGYSLFARGGINYSQGHKDEADYNKIFASVSSDYIAPDKFYIFGGSRTRSLIKFDRLDYNLYADTSAPNRAVSNFLMKVESDGAFEGYNFLAGAGLKFNSLSQTDFNASSNELNGFINVNKTIGFSKFDGDLNLEFSNLRSKSLRFLQGMGGYSVVMDQLEVGAKAGVQVAQNSDDVSRGGVYLSGDGELKFSKEFTFRASISSGLENSHFSNDIEQNPYLSSRAKIDYSYNKASIKAFIYFHPNESFSAGIGIRSKLVDRLPIYAPDTLKMFKIDYENGKIFEIAGEIKILPTSADILSINGKMISTTLDKTKNDAPYYPSLYFGSFYKRTWSEAVWTQVGIDFTGDRYADFENKIKLKSFVNLKGDIGYKYNKDLEFLLKFNNLTNSDIVIWEGYKERGAYFSVGANWNF